MLAKLEQTSLIRLDEQKQGSYIPYFNCSVLIFRFPDSECVENAEFQSGAFARGSRRIAVLLTRQGRCPSDPDQAIHIGERRWDPRASHAVPGNNTPPEQREPGPLPRFRRSGDLPC